MKLPELRVIRGGAGGSIKQKTVGAAFLRTSPLSLNKTSLLQKYESPYVSREKAALTEVGE